MIDDSCIKDYYNKTVFRISNGRLQDYYGKVVATFDSSSIKDYYGRTVYRIEGFISRNELYALLAVLFSM